MARVQIKSDGLKRSLLIKKSMIEDGGIITAKTNVDCVSTKLLVKCKCPVKFFVVAKSIQNVPNKIYTLHPNNSKLFDPTLKFQIPNSGNENFSQTANKRPEKLTIDQSQTW